MKDEVLRVRVSEEVKHDFQQVLEKEGKKVSDVIRGWIEEYVNLHKEGSMDEFIEIGQELKRKVQGQENVYVKKWSEMAVHGNIDEFRKSFMDVHIKLQENINPVILKAGRDEIQAICMGMMM